MSGFVPETSDSPMGGLSLRRDDYRLVSDEQWSIVLRMHAILGARAVAGILAAGSETLTARVDAFCDYERALVAHVKAQVTVHPPPPAAPAPVVLQTPASSLAVKPVKLDLPKYSGLE